MTQEQKHAVEVEQLSFEIAEKMILLDVSFRVRQAEYLSIIGPNGAGKTTLIRCLNRILRPSAGEIRIKGRRLPEYTQKELAKAVSYVPQMRGGLFPFTVREFVMLGRYPHLSPFSSVSEQDRRKVDEALELTGTYAFADRKINSLSGGEFQKVSIASALAQEADIMLLDEPITFLDPRYQNEVNRLLKQLNTEKGVTIIAVSHDINSAVLHSDRILALREGKSAFMGNVAEMTQDGVLEAIFDTPFLFVNHPRAGIPVIVPEEFVKE